MSTNPKTHTLAPEQQAKLNHLVEREMDEAYYTGLYMKAKDARACLREFAVEVLEELGVPVEAREEASDNEGVDLEHCACCGQQFDANHLDHDTLTCQNCISAAVDLYHSQGEAAELRTALRTLVTDLEALMEESHLSLYDGDGALVDTSWGKVLQGGKDEYLSNWRDVKRLAGGGD